MSVHMIYYKDGAKMMRPVLTREEYLKLRGSQEQQATLAAVRQGDEKQKSRLVQMNYSCLPNPDGSLKGSKRMSTTVGMDIDHVPSEQMATLKERILGKKDELGLQMLEMSARKQGYHLVFKRRPELSQEANLLMTRQRILRGSFSQRQLTTMSYCFWTMRFLMQHLLLHRYSVTVLKRLYLRHQTSAFRHR